MPYIPVGNRAPLEARIHELAEKIDTAGELNFAITYLCMRWLEETYKYADVNEVIGVLECVKQEFYRRIVVPYEEKKKEEHGDVYTEDLRGKYRGPGAKSPESR